MHYVPKVPEWQSNQALTAARLNEAVRALNYLLELAAQDSDTTASPTPISLDPSSGSLPPEAAPTNPEPFLITAAGQPFSPPSGGDADFVIPPVAAFSSLPAAPIFGGSAYYVTITTDPVGNQTSISYSSAPGENKPWDGSTGGSFSVCTGMSAVDEYGFPYSFDSNPIFLPVLPIPSVPPCGTATDSDGTLITAVPLVGSLVGNSVPIASLAAGEGVTISPHTTSSGETYVKISAVGSSDSPSQPPAAGQPFLSFTASGATDIQFFRQPVIAAADATAGDSLPGQNSTYGIIITTDPVGNIETITPTAAAAPEFLPWTGSTGGRVTIPSGATATTADGKTLSLDLNPATLPLLPISSLPPCGSATDSEGNSFSYVPLLDERVGNSIPVRAIAAGEGITVELKTLEQGTHTAGYLLISSEAAILPPANFNPLTDFSPSTPSWDTHPEKHPDLGGIRAVIHATAAEAQNNAAAYPQIDDGVLKLFPCKVAFDSSKFALVKQDGYYLLTIPNSDCSVSLGSPIFPAE